METANQILSNLISFSLPVPDIALLLGAIAVIAFVSIRATRKQRAATKAVADVYIAELQRTTRMAQAAESKLAKAKSDLERERRRNRRSPQRRITEKAA